MRTLKEIKMRDLFSHAIWNIDDDTKREKLRHEEPPNKAEQRQDIDDKRSSNPLRCVVRFEFPEVTLFLDPIDCTDLLHRTRLR